MVAFFIICSFVCKILIFENLFVFLFRKRLAGARPPGMLSERLTTLGNFLSLFLIRIVFSSNPFSWNILNVSTCISSCACFCSLVHLICGVKFLKRHNFHSTRRNYDLFSSLESQQHAFRNQTSHGYVSTNFLCVQFSLRFMQLSSSRCATT